MQAGRLRHRVVIERQETEYGNLGQQSTDMAWKPWRRVSAEVQDLSGRELERARQIVPEATVTVLVRHLPGLSAQYRVRFRDRILFIGAVLDAEDNRERMMRVICGEVKR